MHIVARTTVVARWQKVDCCVLQFNCASVHSVRRCMFDDARSTTIVSLLLLYIDVVLLMVVVLWLLCVLFVLGCCWYHMSNISISFILQQQLQTDVNNNTTTSSSNNNNVIIIIHSSSNVHRRTCIVERCVQMCKKIATHNNQLSAIVQQPWYGRRYTYQRNNAIVVTFTTQQSTDRHRTSAAQRVWLNHARLNNARNKNTQQSTIRTVTRS
jgi:hypothetical protein